MFSIKKIKTLHIYITSKTHFQTLKSKNTFDQSHNIIKHTQYLLGKKCKRNCGPIGKVFDNI